MSQFEKTIYYHDTECGGVVYYANYLKYLEEARTEFLQEKGVNLKELAKDNTWFAVKSVKVDYQRPARYQDALSIHTKLSKVRSVSLEFTQTVFCDKAELLKAHTVLVCITQDFKPKAIPDQIIAQCKQEKYVQHL